METQHNNDLEVLWTPAKVAAYLSVNVVTVYRWISTGKMIDPKRIVRFSNRVRIPRSEVERIKNNVCNKLGKI